VLQLASCNIAYAIRKHSEFNNNKKKAFRVDPAAAAVHKQHTVIQAARIYGGSRETRTHLQGLGPLLLGAGRLG